MNTKLYEYMIAAAEQGSITKAARACFISQPALTQHIKNLESRFGFALFERLEGKLVPTKQGEIFLTTARRMLIIERETLEKIEEYKKTTPQTFRIFADNHMRNLLLETIWPQIEIRQPGLKLSLISGDTATGLEYLENRLVDTGIFPIRGTCPPVIDYIPVDQNEYLLVMPPHHPCTEHFQKQGIDLEMIKHDTVLLNHNLSLFSTMQVQILEQYGLVPDSIQYVSSMQTIIRMVEAGQGISFLPDSIVSLTGQTCSAFSLDPPWQFQHVAAYHKSHGLNALNTLLADLLIQHYQTLHTAP